MKKIKDFLSKAKHQIFKRKWLSIIILVAIIIGAFWYQKRQAQTPDFEIITPQLNDIRQTLDLGGSVEADIKAELRFPSVGKLGWVGVKEGDTINKWQALASLDKTSLKKGLEKNVNLYLTNRWNFEQARDDANVNSDNLDNFGLPDELKRTLEQNQFSLNNAVLDVEISDYANKIATLVSPIAGVLIQAPHQVAGVNVGLTDTYIVVDPSSLYFEAEIDETDVSQIGLDQPAEILLDAFPDQAISSKITHIDFAASTGENGGTVFKIKFSLEPNSLDYRLGLNGDVSIIFDQKQSVLSVPIETLIQRNGKTYVNIIKENQQQEIEVEIGIEDEDFVEIVSGIQSDDQIVLPN